MAPGLVARARQAVVRDRFHVAAIDAPGHGDRARSHQDQQWVDALLRAREEGEPFAPIIAPLIPLAVADPRIRVAIFGGVFVYDAVLEAARRVTIPIEFLLPWNDAEIDRESGFGAVRHVRFGGQDAAWLPGIPLPRAGGADRYAFLRAAAREHGPRCERVKLIARPYS